MTQRKAARGRHGMLSWRAAFLPPHPPHWPACISNPSPPISHPPPPLRCSVQDTLARCLSTPNLPLPLKHAAHTAAIRLLAASGGAEAALRYALRAVAGTPGTGGGGSNGSALALAPAHPGSRPQQQQQQQGALGRLDAPTPARIWEEAVDAAGGPPGSLTLVRASQPCRGRGQQAGAAGMHEGCS